MTKANGMQVLRQKLTDWKVDPSKSIPELRTELQTFYSQFAEGLTSESEAVTFDNFKAYWVTSGPVKNDKVILFFHGGGWTLGSTQDHLGIIIPLLHATGAKVFSVDYRMSPEDAFPCALEDGVVAYQWLLDQGYQPQNIIAAGISAGAHNAITLALKVREMGLPQMGAVVAMSPMADANLSGASMTSNAENDWIVSKARLESVVNLYFKGQDLSDPFISPLYADFKTYPPLLVQTGNSELMRDQSIALADNAKAESNNLVELEIWPDMIYSWMMFSQLLPQSAETIQHVAKFIQQL